MNFNDSFNESGEKPTFMYKRNPLVEHSWQIFGIRAGKSEYEPVGEYTLLDLGEHIDLTEKKLANLIALMNGKETLAQLGEVTQTRLLFTLVPSEDDNINQKVIFRTYDGDGISTENAVLVIEKGAIKDE